MVHLARTHSGDPVFLELIRLLDQDLWRRYPETQQHYTAFNLIQPDACIVVAYEDGEAAGCGCFRPHEDGGTVEIKRMFVKDRHRGKGIAQAVLEELEGWAVEQGSRRAVLETGERNPEAISLYKKLGYIRIDNYGPYAGNDESICMAKMLEIHGKRNS